MNEILTLSKTYYYLIILSIIAKSVSYIPFIIKIYDTKYTENIPFPTLFLELVAYLILIGICCAKKYYLQLLFFLVFSVSVLYILFLKIKFENREKFENINVYTPSNLPNTTYPEYYKKTMCRGYNTLSNAGKTIDWENAHLTGDSQCRFTNT